MLYYTINCVTYKYYLPSLCIILYYIWCTRDTWLQTRARPKCWRRNMLLQFFSSTSSRRLLENNILLTVEGFGYTLNFLWYYTWTYYAGSPTLKRTCEKGVWIENVPDWDEKFPNNKNYTITEIETNQQLHWLSQWLPTHGPGTTCGPLAMWYWVVEAGRRQGLLNFIWHRHRYFWTILYTSIFLLSFYLCVQCVCLFIFYTCS